ncbi:hypothetical protein [Bradyrhizobium sp. SZCCHNRI1029]|uniref:hypothetical protein n=1 Tax=Bradyrhizobium sp. SZCCHNRI1029 TaxID=3057278 RepID=UPI00291641E6|nr:hypothetical protein [Bradyrhizobium sp. SZCCHNRI1029]
MPDQRPHPNLRVIDGRKPSVLEDRRAVVDFTRVCKVVGIIDSKTGLIRSLPQSGSEPER